MVVSPSILHRQTGENDGGDRENAMLTRSSSHRSATTVTVRITPVSAITASSGVAGHDAGETVPGKAGSDDDHRHDGRSAGKQGGGKREDGDIVRSLSSSSRVLTSRFRCCRLALALSSATRNGMMPPAMRNAASICSDRLGPSGRTARRPA